MSAVLERRNGEGVVLRYDFGPRRPHHVEQKPQAADRERIAILRAEHALILIHIIAEHADLCDHALDRIDNALEEIYSALQLRRKSLGMATGKS